MKKFATLVLSILLVGITGSYASERTSEEFDSYRYDGSRYIFTEGTVEFSVFPDGQFDFVYVGPQNGSNVSVNVNTPNVNLSFNSGYDYDAYVQYDDYGAVIQVEDVPVYYDEFGRIIQAGNTEIHYNDRRIVRVGGLQVFYNNYGHFSHYTGFINVWTPRYIYRPWHVYYARPIFASCVVYDIPYRTYYTPHRYSWFHHRQYYGRRHHVAYANGRRNFYRPGSRVHHRDGRVAVNKDYNPNRRNTAISNTSARRAKDVGRNNRTVGNAANRGSRDVSRGNTANRSISRNSGVTAGKGNRIARPDAQRSATRSGDRTRKPVARQHENRKSYANERNSRTHTRTAQPRKTVSQANRQGQYRTAQSKAPNKRNGAVSRSDRSQRVARSAQSQNKRSSVERRSHTARSSKASAQRSNRSQKNVRRGRGN